MEKSDVPPVGVIGEDETDCAAIRVLLKRLVGPKTRVEGRYGGGCAEVFRRASAWMHELAKAGCTRVIVVHDLDRERQNGQLKDEQELRRRLERLAHPPTIERLVCIPVEELEAWFWSDPEVLKKVARREVVPSFRPESIVNPKKRLADISRDKGGKAHYFTADNKKLAEILNLSLCAARCPAFRSLAQFVGAPL